ncbi:MAG: ATP-binding protein [Aureliella sp.]
MIQNRRARLNEVDAELLSAARVLDGSLRGIRLALLSSEADEQMGLTTEEDRVLSLPRNLSENADQRSVIYFAIWLNNGRLLKSEGVPEEAAREELTPEQGAIPGGRLAGVRQRGNRRQVNIVGPSGTQILVGRDITDELDALGRTALQILGISIAILTVGLIGGWWLSRSVLRPIENMSAVAKQFSAANMSPRINVVETESELGELATVLNEAFQRVQSSFEQQQQFAADASHELRTPLAVIQSQIELALRKDRQPAEYIKALGTCQDAGDRLSELIESLLALARLDSSDSPSEHAEVRLDLLAAKCTDLMRPVAEHAQVTLGVDLLPVTVKGDSKQLERAILNLLKNSVAYNRPGGRVDVSIQPTEKSVELIIKDTGIGISEEHIAHVTERFYRVDKARTRQHGGSGLGLSIAKKIIDAHRGILHIASTPTTGTEVCIELPLGGA